MAKKTKKPQVIPVIKGFKPQKRRILALHYHPDQIKLSVKEMKEMAEDEPVKNLFEDIEVLVHWALGKLPLVPPPAENKPSTEAEAKEEGK